MPSTRRSHHEQMTLALDDLAHLGSLVDDLSIVVTGPEQVSFHLEDGSGWPARVFAYDSLDEALARQLVARAARGHKVVVANRITAPARKHLASQKWAWLDRRIGAHLPTRGRDIEIRYAGEATGVDEEARVRAPRPAVEGPIRGRAGIAYAAALLCSPKDPPSLRRIATAVGMSPTAMSNAAKHLLTAGLVRPDGTPSIPDLFWALSDLWHPLKTFAVASEPEPHARDFTTNVDRLDQPGWVIGGDLAALALGAPLFSGERRPWLWVPTQVELRRAQRAYGPAAWDDRAATLAVPPTPLVNQWRRPATRSEHWPLPHPTFAALELARDPGRGREILEQWSPEGVDVVWQ